MIDNVVEAGRVRVQHIRVLVADVIAWFARKGMAEKT